MVSFHFVLSQSLPLPKILFCGCVLKCFSLLRSTNSETKHYFLSDFCGLIDLKVPHKLPLWIFWVFPRSLTARPLTLRLAYYIICRGLFSFPREFSAHRYPLKRLLVFSFQLNNSLRDFWWNFFSRGFDHYYQVICSHPCRLWHCKKQSHRIVTGRSGCVSY